MVLPPSFKLVTLTCVPTLTVYSTVTDTVLISILISDSIFVAAKTEVMSFGTSMTDLSTFYCHRFNIKSKYCGFVYALSFLIIDYKNVLPKTNKALDMYPTYLH